MNVRVHVHPLYIRDEEDGIKHVLILKEICQQEGDCSAPPRYQWPLNSRGLVKEKH